MSDSILVAAYDDVPVMVSPTIDSEGALWALADTLDWTIRRSSRAPLNTSYASGASVSRPSGFSMDAFGATFDSYHYEEFPGGGGLVETLPTSGVSLDPIPTQLRYVPRPDGSVDLAWGMIIRTPDGRHWYDVSVSAENGELLYASDWVNHATYNVFPLPAESPDHGMQTLVINPADEVASPLGWHDTDVRTGIGSSTHTRGNNVFAQEDVDGDDSSGFSPDGGNALDFDFPVDFEQEPALNQSAAITNLFYQLNVAHDIHYLYGFDEAAGNFQEENFTNGGREGDAVIADSRDAIEFNNAAFYPTPDGISPRIQMGEWSGKINLEVTSPSSLSGNYEAAGDSFGPPLTPDPIEGEVVASIPRDGCGPLTNASSISGNIALIERGTCYFTEKVTVAQEAGAIGVIITNQEPTGLVQMGGDTATSIPSLMITRDDGNLLRSAIDNGESVSVGLRGTFNLDSSFDNGVIQHEYGHGVSIRLAGGPTNARSLDAIQGGGLGEGWSDWWALMFTQSVEDTQQAAKFVGTYLSGGQGIRRFPYSFDMSINPLTFEDMDESKTELACAEFGGCSEVHNTGEVWASALWDLNWLLINGDGGSLPARGFDADLYRGTGGNNLALQLVMDGIKLLPANPSFLDARDALISADIALTGGENLLAIWTAFARRGMGASSSVTDDGAFGIFVEEAFDIPDLTGNATWFGDADRGLIGDGFSWGDPNNWRTNGFNDRGPSTIPPGDDVLLTATPSSGIAINLGGDQFVNSVTFEDNYELTGGDLVVTTGQISVNEDVVGVIDTDVSSSVPIEKLGEGTLILNGDAGDVIVSNGLVVVTSESNIQNLSVRAGATVVLNGTVLSSTTGVGSVIHAGDFDGSGSVTSADIDAMYAQIATGEYDPAFDLVADQVIDLLDLDNLILERLNTHFGDADLNGVVDAQDFGVWNANRFAAGTWSTGDFNGDGVTDGSDFNIWNEQRFTVAASQIGQSSRPPRSPLSLEDRIEAQTQPLSRGYSRLLPGRRTSIRSIGRRLGVSDRPSQPSMDVFEKDPFQPNEGGTT